MVAAGRPDITPAVLMESDFAGGWLVQEMAPREDPLFVKDLPYLG